VSAKVIDAARRRERETAAHHRAIERRTKKKKRAMPLRGWSGRFPVTDESKAYNLRGIPPELHDAVVAKCQRDGISQRIVLLQLLTEWLQESEVA